MSRQGARITLLIVGTAMGCAGEKPLHIPQPSHLELVTDERLLSAAHDARAAVASSPDSAEAWGWLGNVYLAHGWTIEASECYAQANRLHGDPRWLYLRGRSLELVDPAAAADAFAKTLETLPGYAPAHLHYARSLRKLGRFEESKEHYHEVTILDSLNPAAELALGELAFRDRDFDAATTHLARALALNPEQHDAHATLAQIYMLRDELDLARQHELKARNPTRVPLSKDRLWRPVVSAGVTAPWFGIRGERLLAAGDYEGALVEATNGIAAYPQTLKIRVLRGAALLQLRRNEEALEALQSASTLARSQDREHEDELALLINLGIANNRLGRTETAARYLLDALAVEPASVSALNNLALVRRAQGRLKEYRSLLERSLELRWDPRVADLLGIDADTPPAFTAR